MSDDDLPFLPDWISPPSDTIKAVMQEKSMTLAEFAASMGISKSAAERIMVDKTPINQNISIRLSEVLGSTAQFWMNRWNHYIAEK